MARKRRVSASHLSSSPCSLLRLLCNLMPILLRSLSLISMLLILRCKRCSHKLCPFGMNSRLASTQIAVRLSPTIVGFSVRVLESSERGLFSAPPGLACPGAFRRFSSRFLNCSIAPFDDCTTRLENVRFREWAGFSALLSTEKDTHTCYLLCSRARVYRWSDDLEDNGL